MTETTAPATEAVERYLRFWNAEPAQQHRLAPTTFTEDVGYHAPVGVLTGAQALIEFRNRFTDHMGAARFAALATPEHHHDRARLRWEIRLASGASFAEGTDVLAFGVDGRISSVTSFLDRAPEGFAHEH